MNQASSINPTGFAESFRRRAFRAEHRPALSFEGRTWSYADMQAAIEQRAAVFASLGIGRGDRIAWLQRPAQLPELLRMRIDVGQFGQRAFRKPFGLLVAEGARHVPGAGVRAGHKTQRAGQGHRVHRDPEAHVLEAVDVVVRLVLVPRRALAGTGLLRQHVVVVEAHLGGVAHEVRRDRCRRRRAHELLELGDALPRATGEHHRAARRADRADHRTHRVAMRKRHATFDECVEIRSNQQRITKRMEAICAMIIRMDVQDVRLPERARQPRAPLAARG